MQELSGELFSNQFAPLCLQTMTSDCQDAACDARTEEVDTDRLEEEALRDRLKIQELEEQVRATFKTELLGQCTMLPESNN